MKINTYRVVYRFENDNTEYDALVDETSSTAAAAAIQRRDSIIIVRVELLAFPDYSVHTVKHLQPGDKLGVK